MISNLLQGRERCVPSEHFWTKTSTNYQFLQQPSMHNFCDFLNTSSSENSRLRLWNFYKAHFSFDCIVCGWYLVDLWQPHSKTCIFSRSSGKSHGDPFNLTTYVVRWIVRTTFKVEGGKWFEMAQDHCRWYKLRVVIPSGWSRAMDKMTISVWSTSISLVFKMSWGSLWIWR